MRFIHSSYCTTVVEFIVELPSDTGLDGTECRDKKASACQGIEFLFSSFLSLDIELSNAVIPSCAVLVAYVPSSLQRRRL